MHDEPMSLAYRVTGQDARDIERSTLARGYHAALTAFALLPEETDPAVRRAYRQLLAAFGTPLMDRAATTNS